MQEEYWLDPLMETWLSRGNLCTVDVVNDGGERLFMYID